MSSSRPHRFAALTAFAPKLLGWIASRTVSTPYPRIALTRGNENDTVVLALTRVRVKAMQRAAFDRQTQRVIRSMASHPGLIAYSARRELFGTTGWTMSVWADEQARSAFVHSHVHRQAIERSTSALVSVELQRLSIARKHVPADWPNAIALLDQADGLRRWV